MSRELPSSLTHTAQGVRSDGPQELESFHKFFECWIVEQNQHLQELVSASNEVDEAILRPLLERVIQHYEHYYRAKSRWANIDVLPMFNPSWRSSLEDAFMWIGGWRPSMAFHLLYSKSGLQLEARLADLPEGLNTGDLGDLSAGQLEQMDELQRKTIREEKDITEKLAKQQEKLADSSMVELAHDVTELMRKGEVDQVMDEGLVDAALAPKEEGLVDILQRADDLRLKTLKEVLTILTSTQTVHFLIAAAELHLRVHEWGGERDARHRRLGEGCDSRQH